MSNCVVRFGGNSLSNLNLLKSFAHLLSKAGKNETVVISAIPELQETIEQGIEFLTANSYTSEQIIKQVQGIVAEKLAVFSQTQPNENLAEELNNLRNLLTGIEFTGDCSLPLKDQVISYTERITASIIQLFLAQNNIQANIISPEELGLKVTEEYGNASILYNECVGIKENLPLGINLVPGSYGVTVNGKIARLGKRSADYSAAGLTRILEAGVLELWEIDKEFRTSDAQYIRKSSVIPRLTYAEASELSYFSDQSIHPRIVEPLISKHIPIHVFKLQNNDKQLKTIINSESFISPDVVKSVVHTNEIAVLKLNGPGVGFKPGILAKVTSAFHQSAINIRSVITSQISINIILNKADIEKARKICEKLILTSVSEIVIEDQVSLIAVIGHGMQQFHGVSAKLFTAVAQYKINVLLSGSGASDLSSYLIVDQKDTQRAITEIHRTFFSISY